MSEDRAVPEKIFEIWTTPARRWIGVGSISLLGLLLLYVLLVSPPPGLGWPVLMVVMMAVCYWQAWRMHIAGQRRIQLYEDGLYLDTGEQLAALDQIESIDRSIFTFKPSGGFVLVMREKQNRWTMPGLFWITGRRIGIGGTVPGYQARGMADLIEAMLMQRDSGI
jgi:hypothetical protein